MSKRVKAFRCRFGGSGLGKTVRRLRVTISRSAFKALESCEEYFCGKRLQVSAAPLDGEDADALRGQARMFEALEAAPKGRRMCAVADVTGFSVDRGEVHFSLKLQRDGIRAELIEELAFQPGLFVIDEVLGEIETDGDGADVDGQGVFDESEEE